MTPPLKRLSAALSCAALLMTLVSACSDAPPSHASQEFGHIHGLVVDPRDQTLLAATHTGVYVIKNGSAVLVANRRQDTMALTVLGTGRLLASGHPATIDEPNPLGLITSDDQGNTWKPVAFSGERDFHAIDSGGPWIYAYSSDTETLLRSRDQKSWDQVTRAGLLDIAVDPGEPDRVITTTFKGTVVAHRAGGEARTMDDAPDLNLLDWSFTGELVGTGRGGRIWVSANAGKTWTKRGSLPTAAEALTVKSSIWHAATADNVFSSDDRGRTWVPILGGRE